MPFCFSTNPPPAEAYHFAASDAVDLSTDGDGDKKKRKLKGVAYSGKPITNHWYWGTVIFDLASTTAPERVPVLIEHDRGQRAGFAALTFGDNIACEGTLLDNQHGQAVAQEADEGFPWQMSVHIVPGSIEQLEAGTKTTVNGQEITGPATIFRNNLIREVSLTPTGADPNTHAVAASLGAGAPAPKTEEAKMSLTVEELTAKVNELTTKFSAVNDALTAQTTRADKAEAALAEQAKAIRFSAVKVLFAEMGKKEPTEAEAAPYLGMDETTFSAVAADLKGAKPQAPDHLFQQKATEGTDKFSAETQASFDRMVNVGKPQ